MSLNQVNFVRCNPKTAEDSSSTMSVVAEEELFNHVVLEGLSALTDGCMLFMVARTVCSGWPKKGMILLEIIVADCREAAYMRTPESSLRGISIIRIKFSKFCQRFTIIRIRIADFRKNLTLLIRIDPANFRRLV